MRSGLNPFVKALRMSQHLALPLCLAAALTSVVLGEPAQPGLRLLSAGTQPAAWSTTVTLPNGAVSTFAGSGTKAVTNGVGTGASFSTPSGMSIANGFGYLIDSGYVRKVDLTSGSVTTVAGNGTNGCTDSATPSLVALGTAVNSSLANDGSYLYWSDAACGYVLRQMSLATGAVTRIPGSVGASAVTIGPGGTVDVAVNNQVRSVDTSTGATQVIATLPNPPCPGCGGSTYAQNIVGIAADNLNFWTTASSYPSTLVISQVSPTGTVTTLIDRGNSPNLAGPLVSAGSYLYVAGPNRIERITKSDATEVGIAGASAGFADGAGPEAWFNALSGIDTDGTNLWVTDTGAYRVRRVAATPATQPVQPGAWTSTVSMSRGAVTTWAGNGTRAELDGAHAAAEFDQPSGLSIYAGSAYVADGARIRRVDLTTGAVTSVAGNGTSSNTGIRCIDSPTGSSASAAPAMHNSMVNDGHYLYWLDTGCGLGSGSGVLRRMSLVTNAVSTIATNIYATNMTVGPDGSLYVLAGLLYKVNLTNGTETQIGGAFGRYATFGMAADATNVYITTENYDQFPAVLAMNLATGVVSTVTPNVVDGNLAGAIVNAGSYLYVAAGDTVTVVSKASGAYSVVAGAHGVAGYADGTGSAAQMNSLGGIDTDGASLWIADTQNFRIRRVDVSVPYRYLPSETSPTYPNNGLSQTESPGGSNPSEHCNCAQGQATGNPVDTAWGSFWHTFTDLSTPGRGPGLQVTRTYDSPNAAQDGLFGHGWSTSYGAHLTGDPATGTVTVHQEDGSTIAFAQTNGSTLTPVQPRMLARLVNNADGTYTLTRQARTTLTFNAAGQLTAVADLNGYRTTLGHDSSGNLQSITDSAGRSYTVVVTGGRITKITDPANRSYNYAYSAAGDLTSVTDPMNATWTFSYDTSHRLLTMLDPRQQGATSPAPLTNVYDSQGRVTKQTDFAGRATNFDYTSIPGATKVTSPAGKVTVDYYSNGLRTKTTSGYGTSIAADTTYTYDPTTEALASVTDPLNHTVQYQYDSAGNELTVTDALNRVTQRTYDALNDVLTSIDGNQVTTTNTYDANGNLLSTSTPRLSSTGAVLDTRTVVYGYHDASHPGDVTDITDPDNNVTHFAYDTYGDLVTVTAPPTPKNSSGNQTTFGYNTATGWRTSMVSAKGNVAGGNPASYTTSYSYDADGRLLQTKDPLWSATAPNQHQAGTSYDLDGNRASSTDGNGNVTGYGYDADNELTTTTRADTSTITQQWTPDGQLLSRTDAANNITSYGYDAHGNLTSATDPLGHITSYSYDLADRLTLKAAPGATCTGTPTAGCTSYTYDADGELTSRLFLDATTTGSITSISYDSDGHRTAQSDSSGNLSWSWDSLGRLTSSTDGNGVTTNYGYDLDGHRTTVSYPGTGHTVTDGYDAAGRLTSTADWLGNTTSYGYDSNSNLTTTTLPDGTGETDTNAFDAADELTAITDTELYGRVSNTLAGFSYTRTGDGQLSSATTVGITDPNQSYGYDSLNRLTASGSSTSYGYDPADNIANRGTTSGGSANTQAYNADGQVCWSTSATVTSPSCTSPPTGVTSYGYDSSGDRTSSTLGGATSTFGYDESNNLTSAPNAVTYTYDGDGLRQTRTTPTSTTHFTWDHSVSVPQLLSDDANYYIYGPSGRPLEQISIATAAVSWLHTDQIGSVRLLTDNAGAVVGTQTFDPYGKVVTTTGTASSPFGFTGEYTDADSGFVYLRHRYYDPSTASFLSVDPLVGVTQQPYGYAADDPANNSDPAGLSSCGRPKSFFDILGSVVDCASKGDAGGAVSTINTSGLRAAATVAPYTPPGWLLDQASKATGISIGQCLGGSSYFGYDVTGSICYYATPSGQNGFTVTGGGGGGGPLGANGMAAISFSNAHKLSDFGGPFIYAGGTVGEGAESGGVQGQLGRNSCGRLIWVGSVGWTPTGDFPTPFSGEAGVSNTATFAPW